MKRKQLKGRINQGMEKSFIANQWIDHLLGDRVCTFHLLLRKYRMFFMTSFYFSVADSLLPCRIAAVWLMKQELPENNTHLNSTDNTISCSCYQLKALMCVANLSRCFELTVSFFFRALLSHQTCMWSLCLSNICSCKTWSDGCLS